MDILIYLLGGTVCNFFIF